jgi:hypothetical protein
MGWAGYLARMGESRGAYMVLVGKLEGRKPLVDGKIILKWTFKKCDCLDWSGSG